MTRSDAPTLVDVNLALKERGFSTRQIDRLIDQVQAHAWDEGRESVFKQMLQPLDEYGQRAAPPNPYRGGQ